MAYTKRLNLRLVFFIVLALLVIAALYLSENPNFFRAKQEYDTSSTEVQSELGFTVEETCNEIWLCSSWSLCSADGSSIRACIDLNDCGTVESKPEETAPCDYVPTSEGVDLKLEIPAEYKETELGSDVLVFTTISSLTPAQTTGSISHTILDSEDNVILNRIFPLTINGSIVFSDLFSMEGSVLGGEYTVNVILDHNGFRSEATETFSVMALEDPPKPIKLIKYLYFLAVIIVFLTLILTLIHQIRTGRIRWKFPVRKPKGEEALAIIKDILTNLKENNLDKAHESAKKITKKYKRLSQAEKRLLHSDYRQLAAEMKRSIEALASYKLTHNETKRLKEEIYRTAKKGLRSMRRKKRGKK